MATSTPHQPSPSVGNAPSKSPPVVPTTTASKLPSPTDIPRGPVHADLMFYGPTVDGSAPFNYVEIPPAGKPVRNFADAPHTVLLGDIRNQEHRYTLNGNAVSALTNVAPSAETDFDSDEHIRSVYYPEVERLLLDNVPGAQRIILFDHTVRRTVAGAPRAPVTRVHIDQTPKSAAARVRTHVTDTDEVERLLRGRYRIINVWRPLNGPVQSFPLAFADSATVRDEDLVAVQHIYPDKVGETAGVKWNEGQKWLYWSGMRNEERLLLQCFDSDETFGKTGRLPHTAFVDPRTPEGAVGRESIEVRALIFD